MSIGMSGRGMKRRLSARLSSLSGLSPRNTLRLTIAPRDIRTTDPLVVREFYQGIYTLGGSTVETRGQNPFILADANSNWTRSLQSFNWLRHFSARDDQLAANQSRSLFRDWLTANGAQASEIGWREDVTAERLIALLQHSIILLANADHDFHRQFTRAITGHIRFLKRNAASAPQGISKLKTRIALTYAAVCCENSTLSQTTVDSELTDELDAQVLADGAYVSRNPQDLVDALALILPLLEAYSAADLAAPGALLSAVDRLIQGLRFFRHADGSLARFNGMGATEHDLVSILLRYDGTHGQKRLQPSAGGYQRMQLRQSAVIQDVGEPPKSELSTTALAGCLSFEFFHGLNPIIVNCGRPPLNFRAGVPVWRSTAAHSTVVIENTSSARFDATGGIGRLLGGQISAKQLKPEFERNDSEHGSTITAAHYGYVREFGTRHQRTLTLDQDGHRLRGNEWFSGADKSDVPALPKDGYCLHFHLHPTSQVNITREPAGCLLTMRDGDKWLFTCEEADVSIEESIFFATLPKPKPTSQLVIRANLSKTPEINWTIRKIA